MGQLDAYLCKELLHETFRIRNTLGCALLYLIPVSELTEQESLEAIGYLLPGERYAREQCQLFLTTPGATSLDLGQASNFPNIFHFPQFSALNSIILGWRNRISPNEIAAFEANFPHITIVCRSDEVRFAGVRETLQENLAEWKQTAGSSANLDFLLNLNVHQIGRINGFLSKIKQTKEYTFGSEEIRKDIMLATCQVLEHAGTHHGRLNYLLSGVKTLMGSCPDHATELLNELYVAMVLDKLEGSDQAKLEVMAKAAKRAALVRYVDWNQTHDKIYESVEARLFYIGIFRSQILTYLSKGLYTDYLGDLRRDRSYRLSQGDVQNYINNNWLDELIALECFKQFLEKHPKEGKNYSNDVETINQNQLKGLHNEVAYPIAINELRKKYYHKLATVSN